jgi:hypothetical protein
MICITVARKPVEGTVAENVLKFEAGGFNIDACRIALVPGNPSPSTKRREAAKKSGKFPNKGRKAEESQADGKMEYRGSLETYTEERPSEQMGRWPANLILLHKPECCCVGSKWIRGSHDSTGVWGCRNTNVYNNGWAYNLPHHAYTDSDAMEIVVNWFCEQSCPALEINKQSHNLEASRFFLQIGKP